MYDPCVNTTQLETASGASADPWTSTSKAHKIFNVPSTRKLMKSFYNWLPQGLSSQTSLDSKSVRSADSQTATDTAQLRMLHDPDIVDEATAQPSPETKNELMEGISFTRDSVPLNVVHAAHRASAVTAALLTSAGGIATLRAFTNLFYEKVFADPHLDQFIRSQDDPHGERFARWIAEKMGHGHPWTEERAARPACPFHVKGVGSESAFTSTCVQPCLPADDVHDLMCDVCPQPLLFTTARARISPHGIRPSDLHEIKGSTSSSTTVGCGCACTSGLHARWDSSKAIKRRSVTTTFASLVISSACTRTLRPCLPASQ